MPYGSADVEQALDKEIASLRKQNAALKAKVEKFTSTNNARDEILLCAYIKPCYFQKGNACANIYPCSKQRKTSPVA